MTCHACGAPLAATAKFCHKCGAHVRAAEAAGWRVGLPWGVAGAALGALLTVLLLRVGGSGERGAVPSDAPAGTPPPPPPPRIFPKSPPGPAPPPLNPGPTPAPPGE